MPIVSIVLFIVSGALLLYALIAIATKKITVAVTRASSVKNVTKEQAQRIGLLIAFLSIAPMIGGILGLFIHLIIIPILVFFVLFVALLVIGIKIIIH